MAEEGYTLKKFIGQTIASGISNVIGVIIGYPFDTINVRQRMG